MKKKEVNFKWNDAIVELNNLRKPVVNHNIFQMNLYKIIIQHFSPKDSKTAISALLLAENDEQVYEWLKSEPRTKEGGLYNSWADREEEGESFDIYDENYEIIGTEKFKEKMIRIKGELNDEDFQNEDAYYGNTIFGWELLKENPKTDFSELIELGIVYLGV